MLARVQAAYQQMEGFNADVAHELRTPLATLINGTEVTLSSERSIEELRDVMASNLEELHGLKALINDMLFLARADGGETARDLRPVMVRDEIDQVVEYYEARSEEHTSELQSLMRISYAVFCLKKKKEIYNAHFSTLQRIVNTID